jgi:hypothetical protein
MSTTEPPAEPQPGISHETETELVTEEGTEIAHEERIEVTPAPEPAEEQSHGDTTPDEE